MGQAAPPVAPPAEIVLLRYPVALGMRLQQVQQDIFRELRLMTPGGSDVPARLAALSRALSRYSRQTEEPDRLRAAAHANGLTTVDLRYRTVPETKQVALSWQAMLVDVDELCRHGGMLALATEPLLAEVRDWAVAEFVSQSGGASPRPWAGPLTCAGDAG